MELIKRTTEEKKKDDLGHAIYKYIPYWPLFVVLFLMAGTASWLYLKIATPKYETKARLLIKDEMKGVEAKGLQELDLLSSNKTIENETEVIQSNNLLSQVVNHLNLYTTLYETGQFHDLNAYTTAPITVIAADPSKLKASKDKIAYSYNKAGGKVSIFGKEVTLNQWINTPYGVIMFIPNPNYSHEPMPGSKLYFTVSDPKAVADHIGNSLEVNTTSKQSSIINLAYKDEVPKRAENILNDLLQSYTNNSVEDKNKLATNTLKFLQKRISDVEGDLTNIEKKLQQYKTSRGAVDISKQGELYLENVSANDQKQGEANAQLAVLDQVEKYVKSKDNEGAIVPSTAGVPDPTLANLIGTLYQSELDYDRAKKTTGENNPITEGIKDRIEKIRPSILENIQSQRSSLLASRNNIQSTNGSYTSALQNIPQKEKDLIDISREQQIKNDVYSFLLQKKEETELSYASNVADSKVIDKAVSSDEPVSPNRKIVYLSAFLIALFGGIGVIFGKETLNRKILFRQDIEQFTERPILGEIVAQPSKEPVMIGYEKRSFIAEQFRMLRMTLGYAGINAENKRVLVTSSISGEGKSFVAANLALSLAVAGKKVVLVDMDLNNPSLSEKLDIHSEIGVTDFLKGNKKPEEIILPTSLNEHLYFIPTGILPDNPSELMLSERVEELLSYLDANFDTIILDSAPVIPVTDAYILSPYCDATLYVVRHNYTPKAFIERIDANNKIQQLKNVAIVFNGVKSRGFQNKYYGYGYGYGYNYRYKNGGKKKGNDKLLQTTNS
ncbi:MAG: polysaccharide biosynthesis tyrosine autokinase [Bacteroidota bacterium]|nr:polysaccharide biosynthesis tyrosine autokinase [Bacteroidota bacterium]